MVRIIHMADTHLGYRARRGTINKWAIDNYTKPYEQELYDTFLKVITNISKVDNLDFLIHCGDMFHQPSIYSSYPPPEPARRILKKGLELFFINTKNKVPLIYIEGNHGIFRAYDYTPFESHINKDQYPNLYYFKVRDLIEAIKSNKSLSLEFPDKKVRFYLFPFFEFKSHETYKEAYNNWITKQCPPKNDSFINIAVAHGSLTMKYNEGETVQKKIKQDDFQYDYIALGHEHGYSKVTRNRYYSGGLLPLNFKERYENQSYLIIDIDNNTKDLSIRPVFTDKDLKRVFEVVKIIVSPQDSSEQLKDKVMKEIEKYGLNTAFNYLTAARLKFIFEGEITVEKNWQINELMAKFRRELFSLTEEYNVLQLVWKISDTSAYVEDDISPARIRDYILEKPDEEFKKFVNEKLSEDKSEYNIEKLTEFGMNAIKRALRIMEKEKEV
ncbi:MAG: exonuclease SbcCD subunit D [Candidatus Odinarchaeota archaeon]